jgi:hypothetical protein
LYGGGKALIFSIDELLPYALANLTEQQYQFLQCIKKDDSENLVLHEDEVICKVPLEMLAPKLTIKCAKDISTLHGIYMPSKILLKNAQILLQEHSCHCGEFLSIFKPYKVVSNIDCQKTWYQNNKEKHAEYNKQPEYQASHQQAAHKYYWSKKDIKFPPNPPSINLYQNIVSDFCADTAPEVFENLILLRVDGVTRKVRSKSSDPVK